ncbi:hypothetical protein QZH41_003140 [Actinostola sp. cb2023]|nr:hypothetical protein QZH41_003140 [Actinostola sp. cb2023]
MDPILIIADEKIGPVNNLLHSLWRQVDVYFGSTQVSSSTNTYSAESYSKTVLKFGMSAKKSQLQAAMWYGDTSGAFEDAKITGRNVGFKSRNALVKESTEFELIGPLYCDVFMIQKYLLSFVDLKIKLVPNTAEYFLMSDEGDKEYQIIFTSIKLKVRKVKIANHVIVAHESALSKVPAVYGVPRSVCKSITIPGTTPSLVKDNVFNGQIPKRLIVFMNKSTATNGNYTSNPFNMDLFSISSIGVYVDGEQMPSKPLKLNLTGTNKMYLESFQTLFTGTGKYHDDAGNLITRDDYHKGYGFFVFDIRPDGCDVSEYLGLRQRGTLSIEIVFSTALTEAINLFCIGEFDNIIEIDRERNVLYDHTS